MDSETTSVFPVRFFIDRNFIKELLSDKKKAVSNFKKLSHIHTHSRYYPFNHNVMFDECFKILTKENKERIGQALLVHLSSIAAAKLSGLRKRFRIKGNQVLHQSGCKKTI